GAGTAVVGHRKQSARSRNATVEDIELSDVAEQTSRPQQRGRAVAADVMPGQDLLSGFQPPPPFCRTAGGRPVAVVIAVDPNLVTALANFVQQGCVNGPGTGHNEIDGTGPGFFLQAEKLTNQTLEPLG